MSNYEQQFGLQHAVFSKEKTDAYVFESDTLKFARSAFKKAFSAANPSIVVRGPAGCGKSTVVEQALKGLGSPVRVVTIGRLRLQSDEALEWILSELGVEDVAGGTIRRMRQFSKAVDALAADGSRLVIIVEDAVRTGAETLAEIDILAGGDAGADVALVICGDDDVQKLLDDPELERAKQRLSANIAVRSLAVDEMEQYLDGAFAHAGGRMADLVGKDYPGLLHILSCGVARIANKLVDASLQVAAERGEQRVSCATLADVADDRFGIKTELPVHRKAPATQAPPAAPAEPAPVVEPSPVVAEEPVAPELPAEPEPIVADAMDDDDGIPDLIQDTQPELRAIDPARIEKQALDAEPVEMPVFEPEPEPEPVAELPPVIEPEPVIETPPVVEPEPVPEPVAKAPPVVQPEPVQDLPPVIEPEPVAEAPPIVTPEPDPQPDAELPPVIEPEPAPQPVPDIPSLIDPEPAVQTPAAVEPVVAAEPPPAAKPTPSAPAIEPLAAAAPEVADSPDNEINEQLPDLHELTAEFAAVSQMLEALNVEDEKAQQAPVLGEEPADDTPTLASEDVPEATTVAVEDKIEDSLPTPSLQDPHAKPDEVRDPAADRDPTLAQLKPDLDALELAMADDVDPEIETIVNEDTAEIELEVEPEASTPEEMPEITLDDSIQEKVDKEAAELAAKQPSEPEDAVDTEVETDDEADGPSDTEVHKMMQDLSKANSLEDMDDKLAETLFGDEINLVASQVLKAAQLKMDAEEQEPPNPVELSLEETGKTPAVNAPDQPAANQPPDFASEDAEKIELSTSNQQNPGLDTSASQRLATLRALNANLGKPMPAKPPGGAAPAEPQAAQKPAAAPQPPKEKPVPIEDQIDISMTATFKALKLDPEQFEKQEEEQEEKKGFFSRFRKKG